jgi:hypothetical protein
LKGFCLNDLCTFGASLGKCLLLLKGECELTTCGLLVVEMKRVGGIGVDAISWSCLGREGFELLRGVNNDEALWYELDLQFRCFSLEVLVKHLERRWPLPNPFEF